MSGSAGSESEEARARAQARARPQPQPQPRQCNRCKESEATLELRNGEVVCPSCYAAFVVNKCIKRFELMQRETRASGNKLPPPAPSQRTPRPSASAVGPPAQQRYSLGLSLGPSSTALLHMLHEHLRHQRQRGGKGMRWDVVAVHVVDGNDGGAHEGEEEAQEPVMSAEAKEVLERYRARFPDIEIRAVGLLTSSGPGPSGREGERGAGGGDALWSSLPSATSRADVRWLLTRRALLSAAPRLSCDVLLLGHSTTALAELTLSETAKGRGFALPWLVNDGSFPVPATGPISSPSSSEGQLDLLGLLGLSGDPVGGARTSGDDHGKEEYAIHHTPVGETPASAPQALGQTSIPVYHPVRELFRKELLAYLPLASPPLTELLPQPPPRPSGAAPTPAVVSHRDLSIDDVMARYFGEVEASYPSVVANVVRTTGKLERRGGRGGGNEDEEGGSEDEGEGVGARDAGRCGLCTVPLDRSGDERWRGEIGEDQTAAVTDTRRRLLCYGCERTTRG